MRFWSDFIPQNVNLSVAISSGSKTSFTLTGMATYAVYNN